MKTFNLFLLTGELAVREFEEGGADAVLAAYEANECGLEVSKYTFDSEADRKEALRMLSFVTSEDSYITLSEDDFNKLN